MRFIRAVTSFHVASRNRCNRFWHSRAKFSLSSAHMLHVFILNPATYFRGFLSSSAHRDQCAGRHQHFFNFRSHGSYLQKAYWKSGERRSDYVARCKKKKKHFMITLCDIVSSLCRFRPCFHCISGGFNPSAHFPFMVRSVFCHACRHRPGLSVHSDRWDAA